MMSKVFPFNFVNFFHKCWKETERKKLRNIIKVLAKF